MYGLVPYQLSGTIHAGIQYGHSVVEYCIKYSETEEFKKWSQVDKTFIILKGGTTNHNQKNYGTLNNYRDELISNNIDFTEFCEPDFGDQLTAITFLCDERVFNKEMYPEFDVWKEEFLLFHQKNEEFFCLTDNTLFIKWIAFIGGEKNLYLRKLISNLKLA